MSIECVCGEPINMGQYHCVRCDSHHEPQQCRVVPADAPKPLRPATPSSLHSLPQHSLSLEQEFQADSGVLLFSDTKVRLLWSKSKPLFGGLPGIGANTFLTIGEYRFKLLGPEDKRLCLFVDDDDTTRHPPKDDGCLWVRALSFHQAIMLLESLPFHTVSLDHDILGFYGNREMTGRDIMQWLIDRKVNKRGHVPDRVIIHTANCVGAQSLEEDALRYFPFEG